MEEREGLKEAQHAAHSHPSRTRGAISASLEGSHRDPRLRPAFPSRSRVANLPSSGHRISAPLEPTPRRKGQTALPLTRSSYGGIKGQPLHHIAQDKRRQAAIPHSGYDRSPVRQLRSLLRHPGRCGSTGACDAGRDALGTVPVTILPTPAVLTPPHHTYGTGPAPCSGRGPASPHAPQGGTLSTSSQRPGPPPRGVRDLHVTPGPP